MDSKRSFGQVLVSELTYFWKSFLDNIPEWFATICLGLCSVIIALLIEPKERIAFYENFTERYPYSGETLGIPVVGILIIILPCAILGILTIVYPRKFDINLAGMSLAQSLCLALLLTEALKVTVARPRPNYFSYCKYDQTVEKCTGSASHKRDSKLSFPSGHASNSFASGIWMTLFLYNFTQKRSEIWWLLIDFIPILVATYISSTRITDYMHHVSDVISGAVLGCGIGAFIFNAQCSRIFAANRKRDDDMYAVL